MPAGASCQFASSTLNLAGAQSSSTTVALVTDSSVGQFGNQIDFNVVASDTNVTHRQPVTIYIATLFADFGSVYQAVSPGTAVGSLSLGGIPPYQLVCSGLPAGATCSFSGNQLPYPSDSSINVNIAVPAGIAAASYPFSIDVTSGPTTITQSNTLNVVAPVQLTIQAPPTGQDWALVGLTNQSVSLPVALSGTNELSFTLACSLDSGATCTGGYATAIGTLSDVNVLISVPAGTAPGMHQLTVTATYQQAGVSQQAVTITNTFPFYIADFSGSLSSSSLTLKAGATSSLSFTLNATAGFSDTIYLSYTAPSALSCTLTPSLPQLTSAAPVTGTLTITASALAASASSEGRSSDRPRPQAARQYLALAALFPYVMFFAYRRRRDQRSSLLVLGLLALLPLASCGSGGNTTGGGSTPVSNTYTIQVNASVPNTNATRRVGTVTVIVN